MKEEKRKQLIKDIVIALIAWVIAAIVFIGVNEESVVLGIIMGFMCAGIPFGWRWLSNIITAVSFYMVVMKALLAIFLGWIALPVVIIKDIVELVRA